jgi:Ca-activated chloride channel homolog
MRLRTFAALASAFALTTPLALMLAQGPIGTGSETVARPRRPRESQPADPSTKAPATTKDDEAAPAPPPAAKSDRIPSVFRKKDDAPVAEDLVFQSDASTISVDVAVTNPRGVFVPGIPKGNFRILEDGVPQKVTSFTVGQAAPMTVAIVVEFSNLWQSYYSQSWADTLNSVYGFVSTLGKEDAVAVVAYDIRPEILSDFSTDRNETVGALRRLNIAAYHESNLFDALTFTAQRMSEITERKAIVLIASGQDTFSKLNYGETRKIMQRAGVPVYALSIGQTLRILYESYGGVGSVQRMDWLQADNQMRTFATETGGMAFFPRFQGELPGIIQQITQALRSQYVLTYQSSNTAKDGGFRKIKVELLAPDGTPLKITENGKEVKYKIIHKQGYTAPRQVE